MWPVLVVVVVAVEIVELITGQVDFEAPKVARMVHFVVRVNIAVEDSSWG